MIRFFPTSFFIIQSLLFAKILASSSPPWSYCQHHHVHQQTDQEFQQKTTVFWDFEEKSNTWVQVKSLYDLISCVNDDNCAKVGTITVDPTDERRKDQTRIKVDDDVKRTKTKMDGLLASRNRVSLIKMSEASIWVTGESGSIYERFWNGVQWVIAPHELPLQAGYAVSVFLVNRTIVALSEAGMLYQMELSENSQPIWVEFASVPIRIKAGVISHDGERIYFCTKNGLLLELTEADPPRWIKHGKPPGADVAAIVDASDIRPQVIFTISSSGDLYEYDRASKPLWKKHIWSKDSACDTALIPSTGCVVYRRSRPHSHSLFLLTQGGMLIERKLHQRKWKWVAHGKPKDQNLTSITLANPFSLFLTTASGSVFEYNIPTDQVKNVEEKWVNHMHPPHAKAAKGIAGLLFQVGRLVFPLDDGRLGELHQSRTGGDAVGPTPTTTPPVNSRKRVTTKYVWSILDAPESEGWNAEYCTENRGPLNCIEGIKEEETMRSGSRRRTGNKAHENYYLVSPASSSGGKPKEELWDVPESSVNTNFRLRVMHESQSFFLVSEAGLIFEYLNVENAWFWLRHEHPRAMKGAVGNYNGSLFLVDEKKNLIIRERAGKELSWINCTGIKKGRKVIGGPSWDLPPGKSPKVTPKDSLFFVGRTGRLLQLQVALRKFKWKDCQNPWNTKIASIVDQEMLRENIVFVVGRDGRLYQYNKVTGLWHGYHQSQHMVLSRQPGTAMRPWSQSLSGSLFMISEEGRLIEYNWNPMDGWSWVEHGTPSLEVTLVGSTGPSFGGNQLFLIGSNGKVYLRHLDQATWKWSDYGFPDNIDQETEKGNDDCNPKVARTRPIPFMEDSVIFELRDGRLAEMRRAEDLRWVWWRTIGTPTSHCNVIYWTAIAS